MLKAILPRSGGLTVAVEKNQAELKKRRMWGTNARTIVRASSAVRWLMEGMGISTWLISMFVL